MSLRGPRCAKHPFHLLVGVCAFCLRERLTGLADVECASDSASHSHLKKKNKSPSPRASLATTQGCYHTTSRQRVSDQPAIATSCGTAGVKAKPFSPNKRPPDHQNSITAQPALNPFTASRDVDQPNTIRGAYQPSSIEGSCKLLTMPTETPKNGTKLSSVNRPSSVEMESIMIPLPDEVKMPIIESIESFPTPTKSRKHMCKDASTGCEFPFLAMSERAREMKVPTLALSDGERGRHGGVAARRSLPFKELKTESNSGRRENEIALSDASPNSRHKKKTLSSLFNLDDFESSDVKAKPEDSMFAVPAKGDPMSNAPTSIPIQNSLHAKMIERRCRHGSFSERVEPKPYLFPVPESGHRKPLAWFSSIFRRRKKKTHPKSGENVASFSEYNNGWEDDGRRSWEAPRPSAWEQYGFSSVEGPRPSWDPARPSWEGVMRTTDSESLFTGLDFHTESFGQVREHVRHEGNNLPEECGRRSIDVKLVGPKSKPSALKIPHLDDKDSGKTLPSAKPLLMQRDVSTQTTPPRASDVTDMFIQQRLQHDHYGSWQYAKGGSRAVWSKVWPKTWSNSKRVFKHKDRRHELVVSNGVGSEEAHDQGNIASGRSSCHDGNIVDSRHPMGLSFDTIKEHEAWDTFYSPLQNGGGGTKVGTRLVSKADTCAQKDQHLDEGRTSDSALENGFLKFYLTPVRGHGIKGRSKQEIHAL